MGNLLTSEEIMFPAIDKSNLVILCLELKRIRAILTCNPINNPLQVVEVVN